MRESAGYRVAVASGRPESFYPELHQGPVRDPELGVVLVGTYRHARQVLDTRGGQFANAMTLVPLYRPADDVRQDLAEVFHAYGDEKGMAFLDGEVHRARRRRARSAFDVVPDGDLDLPGLVDAALTRLADRAGDSRGPVDIVQHFIEPLALHASLERRTGIPADLAADLGRLLQGQVELLWGTPTPEQQRELVKDLRRVSEICQEAIRRNREAVRTGDFPRNIITGYLTTGELLPADELDIYGHVNAGYISNVHTMSNIVVRGLQEPGRWRQLHSRPSEHLSFVAEMLGRYSGTHGWFKLVADESGVDLDGYHLPRGTRVLVALNAANQAPDRRERDPVLSFSYGPHTCLGKDFSVQLLTTAISGLVRRFPDLALAGEPKPWANLAFNAFPAAIVTLS
jgi:cytochrome P450